MSLIDEWPPWPNDEQLETEPGNEDDTAGCEHRRHDDRISSGCGDARAFTFPELVAPGCHGWRRSPLTMRNASWAIAARELRLTGDAVAEHDRDLDHARIEALRAVEHLELEGEALCANGLELAVAEELGAERAEPRGRIVRRQVEQQPRVLAAGTRQHPAPPRPPGRRTAVDVPRPDREVGAGVERGEQRGRVAGSCDRSASISIDRVVPVRECVPEPVAVGGAEPRLAMAPLDRDRTERTAERVRRDRRCRRGWRRRRRARRRSEPRGGCRAATGSMLSASSNVGTTTSAFGRSAAASSPAAVRRPSDGRARRTLTTSATRSPSTTSGPPTIASCWSRSPKRAGHRLAHDLVRHDQHHRLGRRRCGRRGSRCCSAAVGSAQPTYPGNV